MLAEHLTDEEATEIRALAKTAIDAAAERAKRAKTPEWQEQQVRDDMERLKYVQHVATGQTIALSRLESERYTG